MVFSWYTGNGRDELDEVDLGSGCMSCCSSGGLGGCIKDFWINELYVKIFRAV